MSDDNPHDTYKEGHRDGLFWGQFHLAGKMRVLIAALLTAKEKEDSLAFWDTVEIIKIVLGKYQNFTEEEWHIFRPDSGDE